MLKLIISITLLFWIFEVSSQSIVVKSFRKEETIKPESTTSQNKDQNGKKFAILKVITTQPGFELDFGSIGKVASTDQKEGEKWYLVPAGVQSVIISNKQLGVMYNYPFGTELEEAAVYVMVLNADTARLSKDPQVETQSISLNSIPGGADIYIDGYLVGQTPYTGILSLGDHKVSMEKDGENKEETFSITKGGRSYYEMWFKSKIDQEKKIKETPLVGGNRQSPEYPGGYKSMLKFLSANAQYPALALEKRIEGTVFVQFIVRETGKISTIRILQGIGSGCDEEAFRLVNTMPDWTPGRIDGKAVPVTYQIPIKFKLPVLFPFPTIE